MFDIENRRYIGNKFKLLPWIKELVVANCQNCSSFFDVFAGTGVVTSAFSDCCSKFIVNDFLFSNEIIYKAFWWKDFYDSDLINNIASTYNSLDASLISDNYFSENFGGKYFSNEDAKKIGFIRENINNLFYNKKINDKEYYILLASLLYSADRAANTCGHYDAFIKGKEIRSAFNFELIVPEQNHKNEYLIYRRDANELVREVEADIAFIDPPYNSRQYSRFYHILENLAKWEKPELFFEARKPKEENMSSYCKSTAPIVFSDLISNIRAKYIVVTYNNTYNSKSSSSKNKITLQKITSILQSKGKTEIYEKPYRFFNAGKSNLENHKEYLFITKVQE